MIKELKLKRDMVLKEMKRFPNNSQERNELEKLLNEIEQSMRDWLNKN
jgi:hypothetical protein